MAARVSGFSTVSRWVIGVVCLTATTAAQTPIPRSGAQPPQPQPTGEIAGTIVTGTSGLPLDGVRVTLSAPELRGTRSTYTDDDGGFQFSDLPPGRYTVSASKSGYIGVTYGQKRPGPGYSGTPIALLAGQRLNDLSLAIPPGGIITGRVFDDKGRPAVATSVRAARWTIQNGERTLSSAGTDSTDDRGVYRFYGLPPGEYVVYSLPRTVMTMALEALPVVTTEISGAVTMSVTPRPVETATATAETVSLGFAEVYYPGVTDIGAATAIPIGVSEERSGVDLRLDKVSLAPVSGQVLLPPGVTFSSLQVRLIREDTVPGLSRPSTRASTSTGMFRFPAVAPGRYRVTVVATPRRPTTRGTPAPALARYWGSASVTIAGDAIEGVIMPLREGLSVSGRATFDGAAAMPANLSRVRLTFAPTPETSGDGASSVSATLTADGRFQADGLVPGTYTLRASGASGWSLGSAIMAGRDTLDFLVDIGPDGSVAPMQVTFTDKRATISGVLQNPMAGPTADYTVLLFPADSGYWVPRARRIRATRPSTDGRFSFADLPPGRYRLAALNDVEPGAWFDPELLQQVVGASVLLTIEAGEAKTQDLRVSGR